MSDGQQSELQRLRQEVQQLRTQLNDVQWRLDAMVSPKAEAPTIVKPPPIQPPPIPLTPEKLVIKEPPAPPVIEKQPPQMVPPLPVVPKESFEVRLGTFWMPRIAIAVISTGLALFAAYTFPKLSVGYKVALSYLCCAALGGLGIWLEKKTPQFGRVLQAGALALTYFVTYAMHFVGAFRVVHNVPVALTLLVLVVAGIVVIADRKQSPLIAGMALFFGYYTSIISGVAAFTLVSNALLAAAALFFLARNRWAQISFGAVLGTYLAYMLWVWKINRGWELEHLLFDSGYLSAEQFRLRGAFLALYWLLFAIGGLLVNREALPGTERKGFLTLNNAFFFVLFTLLMHHAYPGKQWVFFGLFAGALLVVSAISYQRFAPDRSLMDVLFLQGLLVATLAVLSYFKGVQLVAALAVESLFVLLLARWMSSPWLRWLARMTFGLGALTAWNALPDWNAAMIWSAGFAALVGFACACRENRESAKSGSMSALYFALAATGLTMTAAHEQFGAAALPAVWTWGAVVVAVIGLALRTREIGWASHLPLAWAHASFYDGLVGGHAWSVAQSLALVAVTLGFGLVVWGRQRAQENPAAAQTLLIYLMAMVAVLVGATQEHCPHDWLLATLVVEALVLFVAGVWAGEMVLVGVAHVPLGWALGAYLLSRFHGPGWPLHQVLALIAGLFAFGIILWARQRATHEPERARIAANRILRPYAIVAVIVVVIATFDHAPERWRLLVFALESFVFVVAAVLAQETLFVGLAMATMASGAFGYPGTDPRYVARGVAWTNLLGGLGLIVVSERLFKRHMIDLLFYEQTCRRLRVAMVLIVACVAVYGLRELTSESFRAVVWGVCGFVLLTLGFVVKERGYRIAGLVVLALSLVRVIYDLSELDKVYLILACLGLGVILLVLAYLYAKNREKLAKWL